MDIAVRCDVTDWSAYVVCMGRGGVSFNVHTYVSPPKISGQINYQLIN